MNIGLLGKGKDINNTITNGEKIKIFRNSLGTYHLNLE
jgi:hypothetical protein